MSLLKLLTKKLHKSIKCRYRHKYMRMKSMEKVDRMTLTEHQIDQLEILAEISKINNFLDD